MAGIGAKATSVSVRNYAAVAGSMVRRRSEARIERE
jgi:hypothetical protein